MEFPTRIRTRLLWLLRTLSLFAVAFATKYFVNYLEITKFILSCSRRLRWGHDVHAIYFGLQMVNDPTQSIAILESSADRLTPARDKWFNV